jgi:hypothetical protein
MYELYVMKFIRLKTILRCEITMYYGPQRLWTKNEPTKEELE